MKCSARWYDGKFYFIYRLVVGQREGTKVCQKTLLNLGSNRDVPRSDWKAVALRVEAIQQRDRFPVLDYLEHVEIAAQDIVNRLRSKGLNSNQTTDSVVTVDLDTMDHSDGRSVGCERLCLQALEALQLGSILSELGMSELDTRRALAPVAAKMIYPASERETSR